MSDHVMEAIETGMLSPIVKQQPVNNAVGNAARQLFAVFGNTDNKTTRCVVELALSAMTFTEYDQAEKGALAMAASADKASGWVVPENAKGRDKYGPKQSSMATQASMRRQLFGAAKMNPACIVSIAPNGLINFDTLPTFVKAVDKARAFLNEQGVDWQGQKTDDLRKQRDNKADNKAWAAARAVAEEQVVRQPGEPYAMWQARVTEAMADIRAEMDDEAAKEKADKLAQAFIDKHGVNVAELTAKAILAKLGYEIEG